ncbi:MAG: glutamate 5-kinase [Spirochaetaceae bacterium]|jgi:glutamate 5-kinase|nr:glutamate 5-kinase [Spirochaetaceae bacterium]
MISKLLKAARKIVFKFGSSTLSDREGRIDTAFLAEFARQCADFIKNGKQLIIVSSGAQTAGLSAMGKWARKKDIHYRQALCAVGQVMLMKEWECAFEPLSLNVAQILLTQDDFGNSQRTLNMRNTLFTLVDEGVIPIINENDTVSVEEIKIGDNDTLAAQSAILWSADLLVLFSDIDGVYTKNPQKNTDAELIPQVTDIDELRKKISMDGISAFGTGGIETKINAAALVKPYGISSIITRGKPASLEALLNGSVNGTVFTA